MDNYESWEILTEEVQVTTETADCWTCFLDVGA